MPSAACTSLAAVSIRSTRTPARRVHAVVGVPVVAVEDDVVLVLLAGQHGRQHDPVVVAVRLLAEDGDRELLAAAALEHLLDQAGAGHPVADDDQPRPGVEPSSSRCSAASTPSGRPPRTAVITSTRPRSTTSSPVTPSGAAACSSTTVPPSGPRPPAAARARRPSRRSGTSASARRRGPAARRPARRWSCRRGSTAPGPTAPSGTV